MLPVKIPLCGKAVAAIEIAGVRHQKAERLDDCIALFEVVKAMAEERDDLSEYVNTFGYNAKYGVSGDKLKKVAYGQQPFRKQMAPADKIFPFCLELFD